jgi:hypothetical protein
MNRAHRNGQANVPAKFWPDPDGTPDPAAGLGDFPTLRQVIAAGILALIILLCLYGLTGLL